MRQSICKFELILKFVSDSLAAIFDRQLQSLHIPSPDFPFLLKLRLGPIGTEIQVRMTTVIAVAVDAARHLAIGYHNQTACELAWPSH